MRAMIILTCSGPKSEPLAVWKPPKPSETQNANLASTPWLPEERHEIGWVNPNRLFFKGSANRMIGQRYPADGGDAVVVDGRRRCSHQTCASRSRAGSLESTRFNLSCADGIM